MNSGEPSPKGPGAICAAEYRDVLMMRTEMTEHETAARLGITVANVKIRAHRARQQLRDALTHEPADWPRQEELSSRTS